MLLTSRFLVYTVRVLLPINLKDAATAAFQDNRKLAAMSEEERELAAQGYEQMAEQMSGAEAALARLFGDEIRYSRPVATP